LSRDVHAGGAWIGERSNYPVGELEMRASETVTFAADGVTTSSMTRTTEYKSSKTNVTDLWKLTTTALASALAGWFARGR